MSLMPGSGLFFAALEVVLSGAAGVLFFYLVYVRILKYLQQGGSENEVRWSNITDRVMSVVVNVLGQKKLLLRPLAGVMHFLIFWGFMLLGLTIVNFLLDGLWHLHLPFTKGLQIRIYS